MCGRFALGRGGSGFVPMAHYSSAVQHEEWIGQDEFRPRYNIAPRSYAPVVHRDRPQGSARTDPGRVVMHTMRWGVVPRWVTYDATNSEIKTINARGEAVLEKDTGLWGTLRKYNRCVVPVDGYFEWLAGVQKKPHFVKHPDNRPMLLAGMWDHATPKTEADGTERKDLWTFAIVTVQANEQLEWLHGRMPLILTEESDIITWLDITKGWTKDVEALVKSYAGSSLECYPVPTEVGKVTEDSPSFVLPVSQRKDGIQAMFARQKQAAASPSKPCNNAPPNITKAGPSHEVIDIPDSPEPEVIEIMDSPPVPATPAKRKREHDHEASPTPSPRKKTKGSPKKSLIGADKGHDKITNYFSKV